MRPKAYPYYFVNERLQQNDYASAISILNTALSAMPDDAELKNMLISTKAAYKNDYIQRIDVLINSGKNTEASALIQTALQVFPNDAELLSKASALQTSNILAEAATKEAQGDLAGAIAVLRKADDTTKQNPMFIEMQNRLEANYKQHILIQAASDYEMGGYLVAMQTVQNGLNVFPDDVELLEAKEIYLKRAPADFFELDYLDKEVYAYYESDDTFKDNLGEEHRGYVGGGAGDSITFKFSGKYGRFEGLICLYYYERDLKKDQYVEIYGDDVLLYTSPVIRAGVEPVPFSIDVSGVDKLKFKFTAWNRSVRLCELKLYGK